VDYMLVDVNVSAPMITGGRLKPLAVAAPRRAALLPAVPTMAEAGLPAFEFIGWVGLSAAAKTPQAAVQWLSDHVRVAMNNPELTKRMIDAAITPAYMPAPEFKAYIESEVARWGRRITAAGIQPE